MKPRKMRDVIGGLRYDTEKATLLAGDDYWDGHNYERKGRNQFLYGTPNGRYFAQFLTVWDGEVDHLTPMSKEEAISLFEDLEEKRVEFEEAFPDTKVEDA